MGPLIPLQVGNTALIVFVSYFGSRVHRPRLIGYGAVLVTLAGVLMAVPHFISEPYRYDHTSPGKSRRGWAEGISELLHYCAQGPAPGLQRLGWAQLPRTPTSPPHIPHCLLQPGRVPQAALGSGVVGSPGAEVRPSGHRLVRACLYVTAFIFEVRVGLQCSPL